MTSHVLSLFRNTYDFVTCHGLTALNRLGFYTEAQLVRHVEMTHAEYAAVLERSLKLQREIDDLHVHIANVTRTNLKLRALLATRSEAP